MKQVKFGNTGIMVPAIIMGCMRLTELDEKGAAELIDTALSLGINFFDHADIYGGGACEELFGKAVDLKGSNREKYFIQSKCGIIRGKMYDSSKEHILEAVDGILDRLGTEYLDSLLIHRPDMLVEPEEVAEAFDILQKAGKVRHFGVSNMNPLQIQLLEKYMNQSVVANQLQFSLKHTGMLNCGTEVNLETDAAANRDGSVLDYCRLNDITIQAWSPFQYGFFDGVFIGSDKFPELNQKLDELAGKYGVTPTTIATAWILRHPAGIQVIAGTMKTARLKEIAEAVKVELSAEDWYELYKAAGNILP